MCRIRRNRASERVCVALLTSAGWHEPCFSRSPCGPLIPASCPFPARRRCGSPLPAGSRWWRRPTPGVWCGGAWMRVRTARQSAHFHSMSRLGGSPSAVRAVCGSASPARASGVCCIGGPCATWRSCPLAACWQRRPGVFSRSTGLGARCCAPPRRAPPPATRTACTCWRASWRWRRGQGSSCLPTPSAGDAFRGVGPWSRPEPWRCVLQRRESSAGV